MRIVKKMIGFGVKMSRNYQSVECNESIELEFNAEEKIDYEAIDVISIEMRERVMKQAEQQLNKANTEKEKEKEEINLVI